MMKKTIAAISCLAVLAAASLASATVSAEEAARLGKDLTPMGAEMAGNADGTIPAWTGGYTTPFPGWKEGDARPDPYAGDKKLFTITKENMAKYADKIPEASKAMLMAYPDEFRMHVYPTRRSAGFPQWYYDNIKKAATDVKLNADGNGVTGAHATIPFPIPQNGKEVIWNHMLRFQGYTRTMVFSENTMYKGGADLLTTLANQVYYPYFDANVSEADKKEGTLYKYSSTTLTPSRDAGEGLLVIDNIDPAKVPRKAWLYDPAERRVRRLPNLDYDTPDRPENVIDDYDLYSGSPERYDFKIVGKKEFYVPYNNNTVNSNERSIKEDWGDWMLNSDLIRYELHRVWVVEATVTKGQRHVYAKRVFYIDEDSWTILVTDKYDGSGNLWRVGYYYPLTAPEVPMFGGGFVAHYDLKTSGSYTIYAPNGMKKSASYTKEPESSKFFTPAALRRRGR